MKRTRIFIFSSLKRICATIAGLNCQFVDFKSFIVLFLFKFYFHVACMCSMCVIYIYKYTTHIQNIYNTNYMFYFIRFCFYFIFFIQPFYTFQVLNCFPAFIYCKWLIVALFCSNIPAWYMFQTGCSIEQKMVHAKSILN